MTRRCKREVQEHLVGEEHEIVSTAQNGADTVRRFAAASHYPQTGGREASAKILELFVHERSVRQKEHGFLAGHYCPDRGQFSDQCLARARRRHHQYRFALEYAMVIHRP